MTAVEIITWAAVAWLVIGALVGGGAILMRAARIDPRLGAAPLRVRLLMIPGSAIFWPWIVAKAFGARR